MSAKWSWARDVAEPADYNGFYIKRAAIVDEDFEWLELAERLTLSNVTLPAGFISRLPRLWWLNVAGGSGETLEAVAGATRLRYFAVNQVRGLRDLSALVSLQSLQYLSIYGLAQVTTLPSLAGLTALERVEIGQMRSLQSIGPLLDAPRLRELLLIRKLSVSQSDVERIGLHPSLAYFEWFAEDVPDHVWVPVVEAVRLPRARVLYPEEWFGLASPYRKPDA
ncbi:MAG: hypothetical protein JW753_00230 [Dehalococcoidia bacterium]|nr:hypothetical protein [Dehalococcoidia bacterium]